MSARTYIDATCKIGQSEPCGREATHVIAVTAVADLAWGKAWRRGGVIALCDFHASTAADRWDEEATAPTEARATRGEGL